MPNEKSPVGTYVVAVSAVTAYDAARRLKAHPQTASLKVAAGEHLAAITAMTFLGNRLPSSTDQHGEPDLTFEAPKKTGSRLIGRSDATWVHFEVKSLPGRYRAFRAELDHALERGDNLSAVSTASLMSPLVAR